MLRAFVDDVITSAHARIGYTWNATEIPIRGKTDCKRKNVENRLQKIVCRKCI